MNGVIIVNKEKHITSRDVINQLNKIFNFKKIGHAGTLDPFATGVLVVCLGRYTKIVNELTNLKKEYIGEVKVGINTDTLDTTGVILEESNVRFNIDDLKNTLKNFIKTYNQEVPIYSAIKIDGKKLYEYARNNITVTIPKKEVSIYSLDLLDYNTDNFSFKTLVSKGTYIRSLARDICSDLNTVGVLHNLKRTKQGKFNIENSYTIQDIKNNDFHILNVEDIFDYNIINLNLEEYKRAINGNYLEKEINNDKYILKYDNKIIAIYEFTNNIGKIKTLLI